MCANFKAKRRTLTFLAQICPKRNLELAIHKTNVEIRISILDIPYVPISDKTHNFNFFAPNLPKNEF